MSLVRTSNLGIILSVALFVVVCGGPGLAACPTDTRDYTELSQIAWREYQAYVREGDNNLAQASLQNVRHDMDIASNNIADCEDQDIVARYNILKARLDDIDLQLEDPHDYSPSDPLGMCRSLADAFVAGAARKNRIEYLGLKMRLKFWYHKFRMPYFSPENDCETK